MDFDQIDRKFILVNNYNESDYIITNYYIFDEKHKSELKIISKFEKFNEVMVDNVPINSVFINEKK